jgi:hypothetical protein
MPSQKKPEVELVKAGVNLAAQVVAPKVVTAFSLLHRGAASLANYMEDRTQRRYEEFCRSAYEGTVFPENGENLTADELASMLRACLADLEDEKATLYGRLASAIAVGAVPHPYRHPLMVTLRELTFAQMDRLRRAWVAGRYPLIPHSGAGSKTPAEFLQSGGGLMDEWDSETLAGRSMVKDGHVTRLGEHLVTACFTKEERAPEAIGERTWLSEHRIPIVSYELDSESVCSMAAAVANEARNYGLKCTPASAPPDQEHSKMLWFNMLPCFLILVEGAQHRLIERLHLFKPPMDRGIRPVLVLLGARDAALEHAFPNAAIVQADTEGPNTAAIVMEKIVEVLSEAKKGSSERR